MRKLAVGALSFSAAIFAANYILPLAWDLPMAALFCAGAGVLLFFRRKWLLGFEIGLFAAAFGLIVFSLHHSCTAGAAEKLHSTECVIEAKLLDYPKVYEDYCSVEIRLKNEDMPELKALLYDNNRELVNAVAGQNIRLTASLRNADTRYGEDYDHYYSKGIYLIASSKSNIELSGEGGILNLTQQLRRAMSELTDMIFPEDTAHFMRSVLLGDKSGLYDDTALYTALSRAGFMHIAAVSGMHLAFFAGFVQLLTGRGRFGSILCIALIWLFVLFTGSTPSAVRAGFMQSALLMAPVVGRENDPVTSLSTVLAVVLLFNPFAARSISLQLSFAAMAGIMYFTEPVIRALKGLLGSGALTERLGTIIGTVAVSLSVMVFTTPLMALHFGYISILSPISNLLALWIVPYIFCGGFVCCAVAAIAPAAASFLAGLLSWGTRYVFFIARLISDIDFAVVYLDNIFMWGWFVLSLFALATMFFTRLPGKVRLIYPILISALLLTEANVLAKSYYASGNGTLAVLDVGQGQSIACISDEGTLLIDCGGGAALDNAGFTAASYLISRGVNVVDTLVLTHLHSDHANGVLTLMEMLDVENIYMPTDPVDEDGLLEPILQGARSHGSRIHYVKEDLILDFGENRLQLYRPASVGDANERCLVCRPTIGDYDVLITADAPSEAEIELAARTELSDIELYVVGHHGSRYSTSFELLDEMSAETAVISVGYNNYGHPTHEVLERLLAYGMDIYRTDLNGTVEIRP